MLLDSGICIGFSIVSHGHGSMLLSALEALKATCAQSVLQIRVWLTFNIPEPNLQADLKGLTWPFELHLIHNPTPIGFGANHNQAFVRAKATGATWFVVMNPDIFLPAGGHAFWRSLQQDAWPEDVGLLCPAQIDTRGQSQDFARRVMTPWGLAVRIVRRMVGFAPSGVAEFVATADWVNGACMVWRSKAFSALQGFDERYFMYCEDTDICLRLQLAGWRMQVAELTVIHDARRNTGRSWRHLSWHILSMLRLWCSKTYWMYILFHRTS